MYDTRGAEELDLHGALLAMRTMLDDVVTRHRRSDAGAGENPGIEATNDPDVARYVLQEELAAVEYGISVILPAYPRPAEVVMEGLEVASRSWPDHVRVRMLAPMPAISRERLLAYDADKPWLTVRQNELRLPSILVVDRRCAITRAALQDGSWHAALVRDPAVIDAVRALFMNGWRTAIPLADDFAAETLACATAAQIITHLVEGHTDEMAARDMEISVRTYRRNVADIMRSLGANSRFQAGVLAAELGVARRRAGDRPLPERLEA